MKNKSIISLFVLLFGLSMSTTSCEDMLTPDMDRYAEGFSGKDTVNFYLGIIRNVQDMVEQNIIVNEIRSDLADTTMYSSDSIVNIANYDRQADGDNGLLNRAAYYKVINQCNFYLAKVDTNAVKNNIYYMRREYAQVVAIRAWTYLQLVQTYGSVPFITKPVDNADTGWEKNPEAFATADNLVDLLRPELLKANVFERTLGYPAYGTFKTGNSTVEFPSSNILFYTDLILGDLYLLRGQSKADYVEAAKCYYRYLEDRTGSKYVNGTAASVDKRTGLNSSYSYTYNASAWMNTMANPTGVTSNSIITLIPSAANSSFGRVLTQAGQIYGFDPHSTNSTDGETASGNISVTVNYKNRQVGPSQAYLKLNADQIYRHYETEGDAVKVEYYENAGDARVEGTAPNFLTREGERLRFICKETPSSGLRGNNASYASFKYYKPLYRTAQVYLRYAEAINRAGYPRMAFAVLRDGLSFSTMPALKDSLQYLSETEANRVYYLDTAKVSNAIEGLSVDELRRAQAEPEYALFLDFMSSNRWNNAGIHTLGCGASYLADTVYTYDKVVAQRIADEQLRTQGTQEPVQQIARRLGFRTFQSETTPGEGEGTGDGSGSDTDDDSDVEVTINEPGDPLPATEEEINAVETLIADECALEMAYEGFRMPDLIRFARHKNNAAFGVGEYGTQWLAWKIARRSLPLKPYENPAEKNGALYSKLLQQDNWYLRNPEY